MALDLTADQIEKLKSLGISPAAKTEPVKKEPDFPRPVLTPKISLPASHKSSPVFPLLSVSTITLVTFGGLVLLKSKSNNIPSKNINNLSSNIDNLPSQITPTQVPKSIQHFLLTSQQYFSQALQMQSGNTQASSGQQQVVALLNQSILAATQAINEFPSDYRGYYQRAKIYQSLIDSQPQFLNQTIADLSLAYKYNSNSAEITHDLASIYARKGDAQNTLVYLTQTVSLDPTKAQNFYDLAKIQQQTGLISQAVDTYNRLLPLLTDQNQKIQVEQEMASLEKLVSQNPNPQPSVTPSVKPPEMTFPDSPPTVQAMNDDNNGLIIAAPETAPKIQVQNLTDSNALSGTATLPANQKDLTLSNSNLTPDSQVYLTITKGGKNQTLKVLSRLDKSFTVGFDTPISEDVEFKWWIIQK